MELFNEFLSARFQTLIDLLLLGARRTQFTKSDLEAIFTRNHIRRNSYDEIQYWMALHILRQGDQPGNYRLAEEIRLSDPNFLPFSRIEAEYLESHLGTPEAAAFLSPLPDALAKIERPAHPFIRESGGGKEELPPEPVLLQTVLRAIVERKTLQYTYRTRQDVIPKEDEQIPFRIEYQVFDRRWWLILYLREQDRTVKVPFRHILSAKLGKPHQVADGTIQAAIRRYLSPEPVRLLIQDRNNALERAFLTFGQASNIIAHCRQDGTVQMTFDWYTYDREDIVKKLMYLGEYVKIIEPGVIRARLAERLREALAMQRNVQATE